MARFVVVAFVPEKFATLSNVDEAVESSPPYKDARPEKAAVPEAKMPPVDKSEEPVKVVPLIA